MMRRQRFIGLVNVERDRAGLPSYQISWSLHRRAQDHARRMAAATRVFHDDGYQGGEAVGAMATDWPLQKLLDAFLDSPHHRPVILAPAYVEQIGVGMRVGEDGIRYVAVFVQ